MPPKKKKARVQSKNDQELEKLVKWLSRDQLEGFVMASVRDGSIPIEELWNCAPERAVIQIRGTGKEAPVAEGDDRVGTGYFDEVDRNLMREIFSYCGLLDKIRCVTSVCKAWRGYKTIPGLWVDLSGERLATTRQASIYNKGSFLNALLDFVPDVSSVEAVRLATSKSDDHNFLASIFKRLAALKTDLEEQGQTFHLRKLVLQGEKLSPTVMKRLASSGICTSLTSLEFDDVGGSKKLYKEEAIPNLLKVCPNLEEFKGSPELMIERNLSFQISALSTARGGAPPLLKVLDLQGWGGFGGSAMTLPTLSKLGELLPLLQVLKLTEFSHGMPVEADPSTQSYVPASPPLAQFLPEPFVAMPNLKVFHVARIIQTFDWQNQLAPRYVTTPYLTRILTRLMDAAPALESLTFGHGEHRTPSKKKLREGRLIRPSLPTFEVSMLPLPPTLKHLSLDTVLLEQNEFTGLDIRSYDRIHFHKCGSNAVAAAQALHQQYPSFSLKITEEGESVELSRFG